MTKEQADEMYGKKVHEDKEFVVRVKVDQQGKLKVYAHRVYNGTELLPHGYMLGINALIMESQK
jgi:hypothetical protein